MRRNSDILAADDFIRINDTALMIKLTNSGAYDFPFRSSFECRSVIGGTDAPVLLRIGPIRDFAEIERQLSEYNMSLLFSLEQHVRASELEAWYPLLKEYTPRSRVFDVLPDPDELMSEFAFPVFVKGSRQTNRHSRKQCIIENADMYRSLQREWQSDPVLHWQRAAVREFIPLLTIDNTTFQDMVPFSYEFRFFYWMGELAAYGAYWTLGRPYHLLDEDKREVLELTKKAADIIGAPFLAIDAAKTQSGRWIIIEINDGQESGCCGVNPFELWNAVFGKDRADDCGFARR